MKDFDNELSGDFRDIIQALMMPPVELDAFTLNKAMKGLGANEGALIGVLCSKSAPELNDIKKAYKNGKFILMLTFFLFILLFSEVCLAFFSLHCSKQKHQAVPFTTICFYKLTFCFNIHFLSIFHFHI